MRHLGSNFFPDFSPASEYQLTASYYKKYLFYDPYDSEMHAIPEYLLCQYLLPDGIEIDNCDISTPTGDPLNIHVGEWCVVDDMLPPEHSSYL